MRKRIGIIGDGQLGMLLCEAAPALDLETVMLTGDARCAAARRAGTAIEGAMDDGPALARLIDSSDVITYEREDLPPATVAALRAAEARGAVRCFPSLTCIEMLQNKVLQKRWYAQQDLATLPFAIVDGSAASLAQAAERLGFPLVQKAARGGFDGRGVQLLRSERDLAEKAWPGETVAEQYAGAFREIAVLVVRAENGDRRHFGPVAMTFETEYSVLDTVCVPADADRAIHDAAVELACRAIEAMDGIGVFGVELFVLADGQVLINEISPRVHNAGHYTLEACASSQFEQHLRAVAGLPLAATDLRHPAAMKNILCTEALLREGRERDAGRKLQPDGAAVYWYGKSPARLMRKLGHITATAEDAPSALAIAESHWQNLQKEAASA
jgi:5-(carboxyamino)imidazole ribonucleotide synthase